MSKNPPDNPLKKNLKNMLKCALDDPNPLFQERLVRDVLLAVKQQSQSKSHSTQAARIKRVLISMAAIVLVLVALRWNIDKSIEPIAQVTTLFGHVTIQNNGESLAIRDSSELQSGQRVKTAAGSQARIVLKDQSQLTPDPRTILRISRTKQGPAISLEQGAVTIEAKKQSPGKLIGITAGNAYIKVLGTKLNVRLVKKHDGTKQTCVRVFSGSVALESGGRKVLVLPGTQAVADEGKAPVRSSMVFEVNELIRLFHQTNEADDLQGLPVIIDFTTDALWALVPGESLAKTGPGTFDLTLNYPAFGSKVYTVEGVEVATQGSGKVLHLDMSSTLSQQTHDYFIIKIPNVRGWFRIVNKGLYACELHGSETDPLGLIQFHLPQHTQINNASPEIIEKTSKRNRLIVTTSARVRLPRISKID